MRVVDIYIACATDKDLSMHVYGKELNEIVPSDDAGGKATTLLKFDQAEVILYPDNTKDLFVYKEVDDDKGFWYE